MSLDITLYVDGKEVYSTNITHNLNKMADEAGIYKCLWHPEELNFTKAYQVIPSLSIGLAKLATEKGYYEKFDSPNGWGKWKDFVPFCAEYLQACKDNPEAEISTSI